MKRVSTVGKERFKVWRLTDGRVVIEQVIVEFDSPKQEWICYPRFTWGKKSTEHMVDKATGATKYTEEFNAQRVFNNRPDADRYAKQLKDENLILAKDQKGKFVERSLSPSTP
jgi:hypothetical protein